MLFLLEMGEAEQIIQSIKDRKIAPVYLLQGEEPYFIDLIAEYMHDHVLSESEQVFNQRVFYGKDTSFRDVLDEASQYPMMSEKRMVILREAQDMKSFSELESYFEKPIASTVLVICHKYKKVDGRTRIANLIKKSGIIFDSKKLYESQLPEWINKEAKRKQINLKPEACQLLADYIGSDLGAIVKNLDKIKVSLPEGEPVIAHDLEAIVGIHKDFNVFELQKAIGSRERNKIFQIVEYFAANPKSNPMPMTMASLFGYFNKLYIAKSGEYKSDADLMHAIGLKNAYFLKEYKDALRLYTHVQLEKAMLLLREYDLKSKGVNSRVTEEGELLKEMMAKILM
jgi:DNA polymerase-3 subunit delta